MPILAAMTNNVLLTEVSILDASYRIDVHKNIQITFSFSSFVNLIIALGTSCCCYLIRDVFAAVTVKYSDNNNINNTKISIYWNQLQLKLNKKSEVALLFQFKRSLNARQEEYQNLNS